MKVLCKETLVNELEVTRREAAINPNQEGWCPDRDVSQTFLKYM
jgi:hypothetical protein